MWHAVGLTREHLKQLKNNLKKTKNTHEVIRDNHCSWPLMI